MAITAADQTARFLALREELLGSLRPFMTGAPGASPLTDAAIEAFKVKTLPVIGNTMTLRGLGHSPAVAQVAGETLAQALPQFITTDLTNRLSAAQQAAGLIPTETQVFGTQQQADVAARAQALREQLEPRVQLGQLGISARAQALQEEIQRGHLGLRGRAQLLRERLDPRALALQEEIQRGQVGISGRAQTLREQLDPRAQALQEEVQLGQLGLSGAGLAATIGNQEAMRQLEGYRTAGQFGLGVGDLGIRAGQLQQEQQRLALQATQGAGGLQRDLQQGVADSIQAERLRLQGLSEGGSFGVFGGSVLPPSIQQATKTTGSSK